MFPHVDYMTAPSSDKLTPAQHDALRAIAFFRRQKKIGSDWLVGDKRLSHHLIGRPEPLALVQVTRTRGVP